MAQMTFEITTANFPAEVLQSDLPVLVDFTADWCPPCKMIAPYLEQIASAHEGRIRIGKLDTDAHPQIVQQYGVMGLPTLILFQNGKPVERIIGFVPRQKIEAAVLPHLAITEG
jgi:thioredoxin 1